MGKDIHYSLISFFEERMKGHDKVESYSRQDDPNDILYTIDRTAGLSTLTVYLSDAYAFTLNDYYSKPEILQKGDFILVTKPEASYNSAAEDVARIEGIGLGPIGKLMGALNKRDVSTYVIPEK